ncbi:MAG: cytochrome P450 [Gammaproteobacteria bacterium]|nr:cytochrome P450 [Gammaproteobacteria bacterium]
MNIAATPSTLREIADMPAPKGLPLFGNLFEIDLNHFHQVLERWADQLGPVYSFAIGPRRMVALADPEAMKRMFRERPDTFRRTRRLADALAEMRFTGVFSAEGETWRRQRKLVAMALNTAHLKSFYPSMRTTTERLLARWQRAARDGADVDLCADLMRYTVDVTTQLAFGIDFNTLETEGPVIQQKLDKVFPVLNSRINAVFPYWRHFRLPRDRQLDAALADIQVRVNAIIADVRARMAADPALYEAPTNFLEAIIAAKEAEGIEFSDDDIYGNVCTLLLAGEDTTANTIAWAVNFFIEQPALFARARAEADAVLGDSPVATDVDKAGDLPFIEAFYNETMRLKPVAPINAMEPLEDVELMGYRIPRGTVIMMLTRHMATDEARFGHAKTFDPDRWLREAPVAGCPHDTSAYVPFGTGPRFCPGRNLALLEIRTVLSMLCRNFDVRLAPGTPPVEEHLAFTMMPRNLTVRLTARTN